MFIWWPGRKDQLCSEQKIMTVYMFPSLARSFWTIRIRTYDPRPLRSWCIKGKYRSTNSKVHRFVWVSLDHKFWSGLSKRRTSVICTHWHIERVFLFLFFFTLTNCKLHTCGLKGNRGSLLRSSTAYPHHPCHSCRLRLPFTWKTHLNIVNNYHIVRFSFEYRKVIGFHHYATQLA